MENFYAAVKQQLDDEKTRTENGAVAYKTSGHALVDINFAVSGLRSETDDKIRGMYASAYAEDPALAVAWLFFARDVRGGMGERRLFRVCMDWLGLNHADVAEKVMKFVPEYGRWDDLFCLFGTSLETPMMSFVEQQLMTDNEAAKSGKPITLLAKWMPSITTSSKDTVALARKFAQYMGMTDKMYRKTLSALRRAIDVVEVKMSASKWTDIDYSRVPSMANLKYKDAFLKHDETRRVEFLNKLKTGETKINSSTAFPCDIVRQYRLIGYRPHGEDATLEAMWKALPRNTVENCIVVCDSSGSMLAPVGNTGTTAFDVSLSLAVYFAERTQNSAFKDKFITFSNAPKLVNMGGCSSLASKLSYIENFTEFCSTNIEAVFDLLLKTVVANNVPQAEIPNVMIISDMHFNAGGTSDGNDKTLMEHIAEKWRAKGYELPKCVYWNVCGGTGRSEQVPVQKAQNGVVLMSGFSPSIATMAMSGKLNPYDVLVEALNAERYRPVREALAG